MAVSLGISFLTVKSVSAQGHTTRQFLQACPLSRRYRISTNSSYCAVRSKCFLQCRSSEEKVIGARGPVILITDPLQIDAVELSSLLAANHQNCELFPRLKEDGTVVPVDPGRLRRALRHSTVVVALFIEGDLDEYSENDRLSNVRGQPTLSFLDCWTPRMPGKKSLVAFGRATSDFSLTASIYDLVVAPSYQRAGYGSRVLLRIVRELRRRGICDIAVTPVPELRSFFEKCGFGPDQLNSTTMMYTRGPSGIDDATDEVAEYGSKTFLVPAPLTPRDSLPILEGSIM